MNIERAVAAYAVSGEGPLWDTRSNKLYWLDIAQRILHCHDPRLDTDKEFKLTERVSCIVPYGESDFAAATVNGISALKLEGDIARVCDLLAKVDDNPLTVSNDGRCDRNGRFVIGMMHHKYLRGQGALYSCDANTARLIQSNMTMPNGVEWSPDGKICYVVESRSPKGVCNIVQYDYDADNGTFGVKRDFADIPGADGICADEEGNLWVAGCGTGYVSCVEPKIGRVIEKIKLPTDQITSCVFGGEALDTLFVTSATWGNSEILQNDKEAGSLFCVTGLSVRGVRANSYRQKER